MSTRFTCFDTSLGACALAWAAEGLLGVWLPEHSTEALRERVRSRWPGAVESEPDGVAARAVQGIVSLLEGTRDDLRDVPLVLDGVPAFHRRAWEAARAIPPGCTCTYLELAQALGDPGAVRAVGQAMGRNRFPIVVPCHRVLAAGGGAGGFSAPGGVITKARLLEIEGAFDTPDRLL